MTADGGEPDIVGAVLLLGGGVKKPPSVDSPGEQALSMTVTSNVTAGMQQREKNLDILYSQSAYFWRVISD